MATADLLNRITINNQIVLGKPTVRGTRLTVEQMLKTLSARVSFEETKKDFPFLEQEDVRVYTACYF